MQPLLFNIYISSQTISLVLTAVPSLQVAQETYIPNLGLHLAIGPVCSPADYTSLPDTPQSTSPCPKFISGLSLL
jgi:hypothetical protein